MKQTVLQKLIELFSNNIGCFGGSMLHKQDVINTMKSYLGDEEEQLEDAFNYGIENWDFEYRAEDYYNRTYPYLINEQNKSNSATKTTQENSGGIQQVDKDKGQG